VNCCSRAFDEALAASVLVARVVLVLAAQVTVLGAAVTAQFAKALCGYPSTPARIPPAKAVPESSARRVRRSSRI
jgi:hypothetical protein